VGITLLLLPILRAFGKRVSGDLTIIHFDAHPDLYVTNWKCNRHPGNACPALLALWKLALLSAEPGRRLHR
jgi:arginase family enzyme